MESIISASLGDRLVDERMRPNVSSKEYINIDIIDKNCNSKSFMNARSYHLATLFDLPFEHFAKTISLAFYRKPNEISE